MTKIISHALVALVALSAVTAAASPAEAAWRRVHHSACTVTGATSGADVNIYGDYTSVKGGHVTIACPLEDASDFQKTDLDHINVHTFDSSGASENYGRGYVCAQDPFSTSSACLQGQGSSGSGHNTLTLSTSQELGWLQSPYRSSYFAYVVAALTSSQSTGLGQYFYGYWASDA